jgi:hypothetical protein
MDDLLAPTAFPSRDLAAALAGLYLGVFWKRIRSGREDKAQDGQWD